MLPYVPGCSSNAMTDLVTGMSRTGMIQSYTHHAVCYRIRGRYVYVTFSVDR